MEKADEKSDNSMEQRNANALFWLKGETDKVQNGISCKICSKAQDAGLVPTLAVTLWLGWMSILIYSFIFCFLLSSKTGATIFLTTCATSVFLPRKFLGATGTRIGGWVCLGAEKYFGLTTTIEDYAALEVYSTQNKAVIFAVEPHYVLPFGVFAFNPNLKRFPGRIGATCSALMSSAVFKTPIIKQVYSWVGAESVDAKTFRSKLERSESFAFVPGGVQEILMMDPSRPNDILMFLKKRKGFIKIALEHGSPIVPVFVFHYDGSYNWWFPGRNKVIAELSRKIGFAPVLFIGRFGIPFGIPKPKQLHVVCGKVIDMPMISSREDMQESVDKYHALFCQEMLALYDRHKLDAGYVNRKLVVV